MSAQDLMLGARVAHLRELKSELARVKSENAALRDELGALRAHFDDALLAAADLRALKPGERLEIWDGWNLILGTPRQAKDLAELLAQAHATSRAVWIVLDGPHENVISSGRVRVSYTGGTGPHRADRTITDYVRMAAYLGLADRIRVRTNDRDFLAAVLRLGALGAD